VKLLNTVTVAVAFGRTFCTTGTKNDTMALDTAVSCIIIERSTPLVQCHSWRQSLSCVSSRVLQCTYGDVTDAGAAARGIHSGHISSVIVMTMAVLTLVVAMLITLLLLAVMTPRAPMQLMMLPTQLMHCDGMGCSRPCKEVATTHDCLASTGQICECV